MRRPSGSPCALACAPGAEIDFLAREPQALLIVAAVVMLARDIVVGHGGSGHEVLVPDLPWIAADRARDGVHQELDGETHARARNAAIGQKAWLVGCHAPGAAAIAAKIVGSRQVADGLAGLERNRKRPVGIGAAVDGDLGIERLEPTPLVGIGREPVMMLARIGARYKVLAAVLDVAERGAVFAREPGNAQLFGLQHAFVAKAAANIGRHHAHLSLRHPKELRNAGADDVRHLGRRVDHELVAARIPGGEHRLAFQRHHGLACERDLG